MNGSPDRLIVVLTGPTATGKTDVACALQDHLGGADRVRLISADSALVYRGMDIGTAKPDAAMLSEYPHDLIDIRDPADPYTAADFVSDTDEAIGRARRLGQVPIVVGGTMMYVKSFLEGIAELPESDEELRAELSARYEAEGALALHSELETVDPKAAAGIHPNNTQRLLRALEVVELTGQPMSELWNQADARERLGGEVRQFAVLPDDRSRLHARIEERFEAMLAAGFLDEMQTLFDRADLHPGLPSMRAVGYRQGWQYLAGELEEQEFRTQAVTATRRLAKRQMTWLRGWQDLTRLTWGAPEPIAENIVKQLHKQVPR